LTSPTSLTSISESPYEFDTSSTIDASSGSQLNQTSFVLPPITTFSIPRPPAKHSISQIKRKISKPSGFKIKPKRVRSCRKCYGCRILVRENPSKYIDVDEEEFTKWTVKEQTLYIEKLTSYTKNPPCYVCGRAFCAQCSSTHLHQ
jgi:hypothetical protein